VQEPCGICLRRYLEGSAYLESGMTRPKIRFGGKHVHLPASRWVRIALGTLFVLGGLVGFLPIVGFWMIPVGLIILSVDVPAVRRVKRRLEVWWMRRRQVRQSRRT
jgi:hypothetical protein